MNTHLKFIFLFTVIILFNANSKAQNGNYTIDDKLLNIGVGANTIYDNGIPINVSYEKAKLENISIGAGLDLISSGYKPNKFTALFIGVRGSYHFNKLLQIENEKTDVYAGATLSIRLFSYSNTYSSTINKFKNGLFSGVFIGGKYFFTNTKGVFMEIGFAGPTNARIGLALKI